MPNEGNRTASDIFALLDSLQERLDPSHLVDHYELLDHWERARSGSAFYRMTGKPSGPDLLVKTGPVWDPEETELLHRAMVDLSDAISFAGIEGAAAIRPVAWSSSPPAIVMPFVEGTDLVTLLRDPEREEWAQMRPWMYRAGEMIAAYHTSHPAPPASDITPAADEARRAGRGMLLSPAMIEQLLRQIRWRDRCAMSFGDFGPGNLHGNAKGDLYLLDPPEDPMVALVHKDIGNFMFEMRRQLAGHGYTRTRPVRGRFHELRAAFLEGYTARSSRVIDSCDQALIALFEMRRARGMARKRFPGRLGDSSWFARCALARRREVARADCGQP
ncbi:MAG TPA: hypothetical protein VMS99_16355 [Acidimicrobiia bacterium]|nr:hypothetical protein [Acidimicrobiia bacterium]